MKMFFTSIAALVVIAAGAIYTLDAVVQQQSDQAFALQHSVRLPAHGNTHNLVGKDWYSAKEH